MTKKGRAEQDRVEVVLDDVAENVDVYAPEISGQITAYQRQRDSLLYPMVRPPPLAGEWTRRS